jgi:hypothetical protein
MRPRRQGIFVAAPPLDILVVPSGEGRRRDASNDAMLACLRHARQTAQLPCSSMFEKWIARPSPDGRKRTTVVLSSTAAVMGGGFHFFVY